MDNWDYGVLMTTITFTTQLENVLTNATSAVLSNSAAAIGIKRNDTGAVVVAAETVFVNASTGTYTYEFTAPTENVFYTAYIKVVASGSTVYHEVPFYVGLLSSTMIVPSAIISQYVIATLGLFTAVSANDDWPLYRSSLPDGVSIEDNAAAIFDASAYLQGKHMDGELDQRYGIQFLIRALNYDTGYTKAKVLLSTLQSKHQIDVVIGGTIFRIDNISSVSGVVAMGTEPSSKQRFLFSVNFLVTIKEL